MPTALALHFIEPPAAQSASVLHSAEHVPLFRHGPAHSGSGTLSLGSFSHFSPSAAALGAATAHRCS